MIAILKKKFFKIKYFVVFLTFGLSALSLAVFSFAPVMPKAYLHQATNSEPTSEEIGTIEEERLNNLSVEIVKKNDFTNYSSSLIDAQRSTTMIDSGKYAFPNAITNMPDPEIISAHQDSRLVRLTFPNWTQDVWKEWFSYLKTNPSDQEAWIKEVSWKIQKALMTYRKATTQGADYYNAIDLLGREIKWNYVNDMWVIGNFRIGDSDFNTTYNNITGSQVIKQNNTFYNGQLVFPDQSNNNGNNDYGWSGLINGFKQNIGKYDNDLYAKAENNPAFVNTKFSDDDNTKILEAVSVTGLNEAKLQIYKAFANDATGDLNLIYSLISAKDNLNDKSSALFRKTISNYLTYQQDLNNATLVLTNLPKTKTILPTSLMSNNESELQTILDSYTLEQEVKNLVWSKEKQVILKYLNTPNDDEGSINFDYQIQFTIDGTTYSSASKQITWDGFLTTTNKKNVDEARAVFTRKMLSEDTRKIMASEITQSNFDTNIEKQTNLTDATINIVSLVPLDKSGTLRIDYTISKDGYTSQQKATSTSGWFSLDQKEAEKAAQKLVDDTNVSFKSKNALAKTILPSQLTTTNYLDYLTIEDLPSGYKLVDIFLHDANDAQGSITIEYKIQQIVGSIKSKESKKFSLKELQTIAEHIKAKLNEVKVFFTDKLTKTERASLSVISLQQENWDKFFDLILDNQYALIDWTFVTINPENGSITFQYRIQDKNTHNFSDFQTITLLGFKQETTSKHELDEKNNLISEENNLDSNNMGLIVGGVVGGLGAIVLSIGGIFLFRKLKRK